MLRFRTSDASTHRAHLTIFAFFFAALTSLPAQRILAQHDAHDQVAEAKSADEQEASEHSGDEGWLPAPRTTTHELTFPNRTLRFEATAGAMTLQNANDEPEAEIDYVAYTLEDQASRARPVTFLVNGGPGAASAYLHLGVVGPWYLPMNSERIVPSQPVDLAPNPETWLDFTDLVFVDPVGTGFSRLIAPNDRTRDRYLSVDGDIEALSDFISRWLAENGRIASPKYFVGESYGGFRGPLVAETLQTERGIALSGLVLVSPVLDFGWWARPDHALLPAVALLPSLSAAAMEERGAFSEEELAAAEAYAAGQYVMDLLAGLEDREAVDRIVRRLTELTGLDENLVSQADGRISPDAFAREHLRSEGRLASPYDATIATADPAPAAARPHAADPVLDAMTAPLTSAVLAHYGETLDWLPDRRYHLLNGRVNRAWDWGGGLRQPEAVGALSRILALDPDLRVLVVHGYTDLVTPYFATELVLRQLPSHARASVQTANYRGGHMFYLRAASRQAFREDARTLYKSGPR
jgi:carboxypeptidase C (cathepsin A)